MPLVHHESSNCCFIIYGEVYILLPFGYDESIVGIYLARVGVFLCFYVIAAFAGALGSPEWIWAFCDCCNGMMALPNLYGLLRLSGMLREYR